MALADFNQNPAAHGSDDAGFEAKLAEVRSNPSREWAWKNFTPTVQALIGLSGAKSVVEIGGGRSPTFKQEQIEQMGVRYTSNDISARELSKAPAWVEKAHFDVQSPNASEIAPYAGAFDFAFSKMVMEHVRSYERAYANLHTILSDGGVAIAFHPTLYALPFVVNRLMPETLSQSLLKAIFPHRTDEGVPKFPAWYSGCRVSPKVQQKLRDIGFRDVWQLPFYGHGYYKKMPVVRDIHNGVTRKLRDANVETMASFCYTIVRK